ncbi:DNA repair protein RAD51 4, partial [Orchesella cincta]
EYLRIRHSIFMLASPHHTTSRQQFSDKCTPRSTGIPGLNDILNGGVLPGDIIEFYGKTGSGKTQLCLRLTAQFSHFSEDKACVLYFDMKNDFNARRLLNLSEGDEDSLERVRIFREANLERLLSRLDDIKNEVIGGINGFYSRCKLLVIDSVPMVIYPAVQQETWRYHQERLIKRLKWLADHLNLTVILVNHSVSARSNLGGFSSSNSNSKPASSSSQPTSSQSGKAALGKYWQSKISIRIRLSKSNGSTKDSYEGTLEKCFRTAKGHKFDFSIRQDSIV